MAGNENNTLRFDMTKITAREMSNFFKAAREQDVDALAETMAKVVVACPWGDPKYPETYLDLPFYGEFQDVLAGLVEAGKNAGKR